MASLSDILNTVQQGVVAVNNLVTQTSGSFLNIQSQLNVLSSAVATLSSAAAASSGVKTFNTRVGNVVPVQGDYPTSLIPGTTTNNNATAGNIGEYVSATVPSTSPVTAGSAANTVVTSLGLSAGDWDVWGTIGVLPAAALSQIVASVSTSSSTFPDLNGATVVLQQTFTAGARQTLPISARQVSVSSSITMFLLVQIISSGTLYGTLVARRAR